ncbi:type II-A CRISPR-associated protein Csn2 [Ruminococcus flavefaciens]|uniref:type II-A CRISPR-associated protein Csn2 n=1 Tax=Ruminococcus flavefaciens TaxID=1265 RepID=UPI00048CB594|nr:type II-A CRISPR-associated protein Csn2 [Ruminococcus flavefaciens]
MMIAYPAADICCELNEDKILTLTIENQHLFYSIINDIQTQLEGNDGKFVLSENFQPLDMRKYIELITQLVPFTVNQKELVSKLHFLLKRKAVDEIMYQSTHEIISKISEYLYKLTEEQDMELAINAPDDIAGILKAFDVRFEDNDMSLPEKILEYTITSNELKGTKLFIIVNLRSYLTDAQAEQLFQSMLLKKLQLICIESSEHERLKNEEVIIIDKDMCII